MDLAEMLRASAHRHASRTAIVSGVRRIDYGTLWTASARFAAVLRDLSVRPGEHVALLLPNLPSTATPPSPRRR